MKFLADMGISPRTVRFLCNLGHEALHLHEQGLDQMADSNIMGKARNEGMRPENVNRYLQRVISEQEQSLTNGAIISVTEGQIRIRALPVRTTESS